MICRLVQEKNMRTILKMNAFTILRLKIKYQLQESMIVVKLGK